MTSLLTVRCIIQTFRMNLLIDCVQTLRDEVTKTFEYKSYKNKKPRGLNLGVFHKHSGYLTSEMTSWESAISTSSSAVGILFSPVLVSTTAALPPRRKLTIAPSKPLKK